MVLLFSYGTLRLPAVQTAVFGRPVPAEPDAITGHRLDQVTITDPHVVATSGSAVHPVLVPDDTAGPASDVEGVVLELTDAQLAAADSYEVDAYVRVSYPLRSGRTAWVYVLAAAPGASSAGPLGEDDRQVSEQQRTH